MIALFTMGGTIAMRSRAGRGAVPALAARDLLASLPGLDRLGVEVEVHDVRQSAGGSLTFDDLAELAGRIRRRLTGADGEPAADGAVVTQGTDTIEETSYLLDLLHDLPAPVVVTGAMRNPELPGHDGPANLSAALRLAGSPAARGLGCLVVLADEIHAARQVRKTHASGIHAFTSPNTGPIGRIEGGRARIWAPPRRPVVPALASVIEQPTERPGEFPRVAVWPMTLGDDGEALAAAAERLDGLVIAGFGVGHVPERTVPLIAALASRMPVALSTRAGAGSVGLDSYGYPGSETDLLGRGLISAGYLDPLKARLLLHALLVAKASRSEIAAAFAQHGAP